MTPINIRDTMVARVAELELDGAGWAFGATAAE